MRIQFIIVFLFLSVLAYSQRTTRIIYREAGEPFITEWTVAGDATARTVTLPLYNSGVFNARIDWGDGSDFSFVTAYNDADRIHTYALDGTYQISIYGACPGWSFNDTGDKLKIVEIVSWGIQGAFDGFSYLSQGFAGCTNLDTVCGGFWLPANMSMCDAFYNCTGLKYVDAGDWDMSKVTYLRGVFYNCTSLNSIDVSNWDVSKVTYFGETPGGNSGLFQNCSSLTTLDCGDWVFNSTSNISFGSCFRNCTKLTTIGDVSDWNTTKITDFQYAFSNCNALLSLACDTWDVSNCTNFAYMFDQCYKITSMPVDDWNITKATTMAGMFRGCRVVTSMDLSAWVLNTTSSLTLSYLFDDCRALTTTGDITGWNTSKVTSMSRMFGDCWVIDSIYCSTWNTGAVTDIQGMFYKCNSITTTIPVDNWDVDQVTSYSGSVGGMWCTFYCTNIKYLNLTNWTINTSSSVSFEAMFYGAAKLDSIIGLNTWNTSKISSFKQTFQGCVSMDTIDVSDWDVSNCTNFSYMFNGCTGITTLELGAWDFNVSSNINFSYVFNDCTKLSTIDTVGGWNTTKFTDLTSCFQNCQELDSLQCSDWDMSNVTTMNAMFYNCDDLITLSIPDWNVSKVTSFGTADWNGMFENCALLATLDVSNWTLNTTSNISMSYMFSASVMTALDISGWNMTKVTNTTGMFYNCSSLDGTMVIPSTLTICGDKFATGCSGIDQWNFYPNTQPTTSGTPFGNYAVPLHVPAGSTSYTTAPWTTVAIFSSITKDL